jgi:pimeloyl-ACP methyl ester carboxylesterase
VHGAWQGASTWDPVVERLRSAGHRVFTPTLTGCGERAHLLTPEVDLNLHIADVLELLRFENLRDVVLVGHSYGGMVVAGVIERASEPSRRWPGRYWRNGRGIPPPYRH